MTTLLIPTRKQIRILQALSEPKMMNHIDNGSQHTLAATLIRRGFITAEKRYTLPGNPLVYSRTEKGTQLLELLK